MLPKTRCADFDERLKKDEAMWEEERRDLLRD
jgi:hypothetical protein